MGLQTLQGVWWKKVDPSEKIWIGVALVPPSPSTSVARAEPALEHGVTPVRFAVHSRLEAVAYAPRSRPSSSSAAPRCARGGPP